MNGKLRFADLWHVNVPFHEAELFFKKDYEHWRLQFWHDVEEILLQSIQRLWKGTFNAPTLYLLVAEPQELAITEKLKKLSDQIVYTQGFQALRWQ